MLHAYCRGHDPARRSERTPRNWLTWKQPTEQLFANLIQALDAPAEPLSADADAGAHRSKMLSGVPELDSCGGDPGMSTSSIAILKPDHLGDLVLSVPAIRAVRARYRNITLFVASSSRPLAGFLFPDIEDIRSADLPHLARNGEAHAARYADRRVEPV